jgi:hypothetical protein
MQPRCAPLILSCLLIESFGVKSLKVTPLNFEKACGGTPYVPPQLPETPTIAPPTAPPELDQSCDDLVHYT